MNIADFRYHSQLSFDFNYSKPLELTALEVSILKLLEDMDFSCFEREEERRKKGRTANLDAYTMMVIILYARANGCYSSRETERLGSRDIFIHSVLAGKAYPDHVTINRFIKRHPKSIEQVLASCVRSLDRYGEISKKILFQDGTKIESRANRYSFVWKTGVQKNKEKLKQKCLALAERIADHLCLEYFAIDEYDDEINKLMILKSKIENSGVPYMMIAGCGRGRKRLTPEQRFYRDIVSFTGKYREYVSYLNDIGEGRKSMSRTDKDATFMRMKEDAMKNGQLKPAYNIQTLVDSNYIIGCYSSSDRTDYATAIPSIEKISSIYSWKYDGYCADSGYDTLYNHRYLEEHGITDYIKPQNFEISKTKKVRNSTGLYSNMAYDERMNEFTCRNGKKLVAVKSYWHRKKQITKFSCLRGCVTCQFRNECISGKGKSRYKSFSISLDLERYRRVAIDNITTRSGAEIRANRSIQAEGAFAQIKANNSFRRFLCFGRERTTTEWILMSLAVNITRFSYRLEQGLAGKPFWYSIPA